MEEIRYDKEWDLSIQLTRLSSVVYAVHIHVVKWLVTIYLVSQIYFGYNSSLVLFVITPLLAYFRYRLLYNNWTETHNTPTNKRGLQ